MIRPLYNANLYQREMPIKLSNHSKVIHPLQMQKLSNCVFFKFQLKLILFGLIGFLYHEKQPLYIISSID